MTKPLEPSKRLRCAIYTRKSSEEGLDQAFNSLHAQREACEAYVRSQANEGWQTLPAAYDDGGYSGGTLDRPAIQKLLADIDAGRVDTVVVYKIDRLTRSLSDFAKIVERMDAAGASFVSITQAFNTTTSMGRLTLNVLLSFAQFEREVTGERIRDKIAASKAKGMWMGGTLPLGYDRPADPVTRALVINNEEAEQVRLIFTRYLELRSVSTLERWLDEQGIRSKAYITRAGRALGGARFSRGALFHLLANRTYLGDIRHKDTSYPGAHPPIVEPALFGAVELLLAGNRKTHYKRPTKVSTMPLKGRIFDADNQPMNPTFGHGSKGQVYRYYVSAPLQQGRGWQLTGDAIRRIPAEAIEELVLERLQLLPRGRRGAAMTWATTANLLKRVEVHAGAVHLLITASTLFGAHADIDVETARLSVRLPEGERTIVEGDAGVIRIIIPVRLKLRGGRSWIETPTGSPAVVKPKLDRALIKGLKSARHMVDRLGPFVDEAASSRSAAPATAYERALCRLAFLAPDIQRAILEGRQSPGFNLQQLIKREIPLAWVDQRTAFGF